MEQYLLPFAAPAGHARRGAPSAAELAERRTRALSALEIDGAGMALRAMHGDDLEAPADDVAAVVRNVSQRIPKQGRRVLLAALCRATGENGGHVYVHRLDAFHELAALLAPHGQFLRDALDDLDRANAHPGRELIEVRDCYGGVHRVRSCDLANPNITLLRCFQRDGAPVAGQRARVHRENIDHDGQKAAAAWKDLPYVAAKGDRPFASERSARAALKRLGQSAEDYDLTPVDGGLVAVLRAGARQASPAPAP
jgi:hypothetical protein